MTEENERTLKIKQIRREQLRREIAEQEQLFLRLLREGARPSRLAEIDSSAGELHAELIEVDSYITGLQLAELMGSENGAAKIAFAKWEAVREIRTGGKR